MRIAQLLSVVCVLVLTVAGVSTMLFPEKAAVLAGFNPTDNYGLTNIRTLGAPTLALAIAAVIGIYKNQWLLILPASLYFILNFTSRVISVLVEGYEPVMFKGLLITFGLFLISQVAIFLFRKAEQKSTQTT